MINSEHNAGLLARSFNNLTDIDRSCDVESAMTDEDSYSFVWRLTTPSTFAFLVSRATGDG